MSRKFMLYGIKMLVIVLVCILLTSMRGDVHFQTAVVLMVIGSMIEQLVQVFQ